MIDTLSRRNDVPLTSESIEDTGVAKLLSVRQLEEKYICTHLRSQHLGEW